MKGFTDLFIRRPVLALVVSLVILIAGLQAISSLNRKQGPGVLDTINAAIASDPDVQVRRRGVDALASLPDGAGVPALIQLVKSSKDMDVRKQAMNKLQNSHDSRAEAFFEEVLK